MARSKERLLTAEEAVELACKELAPFWTAEEALLAGVIGPDGVATAIPLVPAIRKGIWILAYLDPMTPRGETFLALLRQWNQRYAQLGVRLIIIFEVPYAPLRRLSTATPMIPRGSSIVGAVDPDGALMRAFFPAPPAEGVGAVALADGVERDRTDSIGGMREFEISLQRALREADPGLPLAPTLSLGVGDLEERLSVEFGRAASMARSPRAVTYPAEFHAPAASARDEISEKLMSSKEKARRAAEALERMRTGAQSNERWLADFGPALVGNDAGPLRFRISGTWHQDLDRITTEDPKAEIEFMTDGNEVGVIAESLSTKREPTRLQVEVNGVPILEDFWGEAFTPAASPFMDENGNPLVRIEGGRLYALTAALDEKSRRIKLRFPSAARVGIALYGIRIAERRKR